MTFYDLLVFLMLAQIPLLDPKEEMFWGGKMLHLQLDVFGISKTYHSLLLIQDLRGPKAYVSYAGSSYYKSRPRERVLYHFHQPPGKHSLLQYTIV